MDRVKYRQNVSEEGLILEKETIDTCLALEFSHSYYSSIQLCNLRRLFRMKCQVLSLVFLLILQSFIRSQNKLNEKAVVKKYVKKTLVDESLNI